MRLTEFLLARIAEDEANAGRYLDVFPEGDMAPLFRRVLAECVAKRRIVERASRSVVATSSRRPSPFGNLSFSDGRYYDGDRDVTDEMAAWHLVDGEPTDPTSLRILAAVYADHPDYRDEWKP